MVVVGFMISVRVSFTRSIDSVIITRCQEPKSKPRRRRYLPKGDLPKGETNLAQPFQSWGNAVLRFPSPEGTAEIQIQKYRALHIPADQISASFSRPFGLTLFGHAQPNLEKVGLWSDHPFGMHLPRERGHPFGMIGADF